MALRQKVSEFEFEGRVIKLIDTFGVFITVTPPPRPPAHTRQTSLECWRREAYP